MKSDNDWKSQRSQNIWICYVCSSLASKQIDLESPAIFQVKDNFKGFPTVLYLIMFQHSDGKLFYVKHFKSFFPHCFSTEVTRDTSFLNLPQPSSTDLFLEYELQAMNRQNVN